MGHSSMWGASMSYEQLLSIQQHQHTLATQHKEAEVAHLRAYIDMLEAEHPEHERRHVAEALRTKDEEAALMMAAKHKELELMAGLLQLREQQIEDLRQLCEAQQAEIQQLRRRRLAPEGGPGPDAHAEERRGGHHREAAHAAIPESPAGSAVVRRGSLASASGPAHDDHAQLEREVRRLRLKMEEMEAAISEQHERSAGLSRALEAKTERVRALEDQVRTLHSPAAAWPDSADSSMMLGGGGGGGGGGGAGSCGGPGVAQASYPPSPSPPPRPCGMQVDHRQHTMAAGAFTMPASVPEEPVAAPAPPPPPPPAPEFRPNGDLGHGLGSHGALGRGGGGGPRLPDPGRAISRAETMPRLPLPPPNGGDPGLQRPWGSVQEPPRLAGGRAAAATYAGDPYPPRSMDDLALRQVGGAGADQLDMSSSSQPPTYRSAVRLDLPPAGGARGLAAAPPALRPGAATSSPSPGPCGGPGGGGGLGEASVPSWAHGAPEAAETGRQSQELLREMRRLRLQMSELERVAGRSAGGAEFAAAATGPQHVGNSAAASSFSPAVPREPAAGPGPPAPEFAGWEYRPHASGDPVDAAVAALVNRPGGRYRGWRALLCRLEQGVYLCGTRRVHLRADAAAERIEASADGGRTWADLEELMRGAEASQHALLERARGGAAAAAGGLPNGV